MKTTCGPTGGTMLPQPKYTGGLSCRDLRDALEGTDSRGRTQSAAACGFLHAVFCGLRFPPPSTGVSFQEKDSDLLQAKLLWYSALSESPTVFCDGFLIFPAIFLSFDSKREPV